jgi:hypothetical protein
MKKARLCYTITLVLCLIMLIPYGTFAQTHPAIGLAPDDGFPIWLTPLPDDYLPLRANQTSGLDWIATDTDENGNPRHYLLIADDSDDGAINLISVQESDGAPEIQFQRSHLTLPPPEVSMVPLEPGHGYDWEGICAHPWSDSVFLSQEGSVGEIGIYNAFLSPSGIRAGVGAYGRAGEVSILPGSLSFVRKLNMPGWSEAFGDRISDNMGIEGIACSENRLFLGLESPYEFADRLVDEMSTCLAVWRIDPADPANTGEMELPAIHDTADWENCLGFKIETICGLDAIDDNHLVGIDRDNACLFAVEFDDNGAFVDGRIFWLSTPGPAPRSSDGCPEIDHLPRLVRPSLESVAVVPDGEDAYFIYLAVDPWAPGWALLEHDWSCPGYEARLHSLLPALYRYSVTKEMLFPEI